jgi:malate dehydrogenase (oxaloacetate-decarboxylating)
MNFNEEVLKLHEENRVKIEVINKTKVKDMHYLAIVYTPGVAEPYRKIHEEASKVYEYTLRGGSFKNITNRRNFNGSKLFFYVRKGCS